MNKNINVSRETKRIVKKFFLLIFFFLIVIQNQAASFLAVENIGVNARAYILVDSESGSILVGDNYDESMGIASTSKVMSLYIFLEYIKENDIQLDSEVSFSEKASLMSYNYEISGRKNFPTGATFTVEELINLIAIESDNSATVALAEEFYGSEESFVAEMNKKSGEFGMLNTTYYNSTGLTEYDYPIDYQLSNPDVYNTSTARDQAIVARKLLQDYPEILTIFQKTTYILDGVEGSTYNEMLPGERFEYEGVQGLKTGTTDEAGACFIGYYVDDERSYISVVLDSDRNNAVFSNSDTRFIETGVMYDWSNAQTYSEPLSSDTEIEVSVPGANGHTNTINPKYSYINSSDDTINMTVLDFQLNDDLQDEDGGLNKNVEAGEDIGEITITTFDNDVLQTLEQDNSNEEENILVIPVVATETIKKENFIWYTINNFTTFWNDFNATVFNDEVNIANETTAE